ncbi:MAG: hypothetical protein IPG38_18330 [Chitinophagaceae bacterium]|nr:hypothetical protein [Chitinophagaceae bacterium]
MNDNAEYAGKFYGDQFWSWWDSQDNKVIPDERSESGMSCNATKDLCVSERGLKIKSSLILVPDLIALKMATWRYLKKTNPNLPAQQNL